MHDSQHQSINALHADAREAPACDFRAHCLTAARQHPSPNFNERPGTEINLVVVHAISLPPEQYGGPFIDQLFTNTLNPAAHPYFEQIAGLTVSAHFLIRREGELVQYVPCDKRAWHAGESCWQGRANCNDFSIGIELEGSDYSPYDYRQYRQLARLIRLLMAQYDIDYAAIAGHCDIAPQRKTDPGPAFDWAALRILLAEEQRQAKGK